MAPYLAARARALRLGVELRERLSLDDVAQPLARGHVLRYALAASYTRPGDRVGDVACGIGYGAAAFHDVEYDGYDRPGVPDERFAALDDVDVTFYEADLNDRSWRPERDVDVLCCYETLEHLVDPHRLALRLARWVSRLIFVSVPTIPTAHANPYHLHDFTVEDVPPMFPGWEVVEVWEQVEEFSHVWLLGWGGTGWT